MGAILVGKLAGTRIVQHVRVGEVSHISEQLCGADAIIAISEYIKRRLNQLTLPIGNLHVVYPGIDTKYFRPGVTSGVEARRSLRIPQTASVIAMVARFSPMKRHDVLIEACQTLTCRLPNLRLLLVSDVGSMENAWFDRVQKFITQKRFRRMVTVLPFCDDVRKVYAAADVAVLPSEGEGLGRCIIEAMAMGTPVVVTDSGGLPELVTDRKTGRVVSSGDQSGLANAIAEVLADPVLRGNLSAAARLFVEKQLTDEESARKVMHIYNQLRPGPGR
jgi:1,4-alpha-glucan branching enzyme